jgi:hypothetical protein
MYATVPSVAQFKFGGQCQTKLHKIPVPKGHSYFYAEASGHTIILLKASLFYAARLGSVMEVTERLDISLPLLQKSISSILPIKLLCKAWT